MGPLTWRPPLKQLADVKESLWIDNESTRGTPKSFISSLFQGNKHPWTGNKENRTNNTKGCLGQL